MLRAKMSGAIFLLPLYAVTTWKGTWRYTNSIQGFGFVRLGQQKSQVAVNTVLNLMGSIHAGMS